jgi:repressor of nif and glnA expression
VDHDELQEILSILEAIPFYGYRKVAQEMKKQGTDTSAKRVRRIMRKFGLKAIFAKTGYIKGSKGAQEVPVSSFREGNSSSQSGVGQRYHLSQATRWSCLSGGNSGLVFQKGFELAAQ